MSQDETRERRRAERRAKRTRQPVKIDLQEALPKAQKIAEALATGEGLGDVERLIWGAFIKGRKLQTDFELLANVLESARERITINIQADE